MFGGRIGGSLGGLDLTLWYDYLSGDGRFGTMARLRSLTRSLRPITSTMGTPIYFSIFRSTLGGWGCRTLALKAALPLSDQVSLGVHGHSFRTAQQGDLESSIWARKSI